MPRLNPLALTLALAGMASFAPFASHAVSLSSGGTGQVLIFPYYTVRTSIGGAYNTLIAISNDSNQFKALKVRFLEVKNAREVMDLNVFLSPQDSWTAALIATDTGTRIVTNDNSCVGPSNLFKPGSTIDTFRNLNYSGSRADGGGETLDRTREGYFEVIEMGVISSALVQSYVAQATSGIPANCGALDAMDPGSGNSTNIFPGNFLAPPGGGITGRASIINAERGVNFTYFPEVLNGWSDVVAYGGVGSENPKLGAASPPVSKVQLSNGDLLESTWANGRDAVSATLMRASISNEFILDIGTASITDWVVTFPTKREYVSTGSAAAPFSNGFGSAGACDLSTTTPDAIRDREGQGCTPQNCVNPNGTPIPMNFCWTANVIPFGIYSVFGTRSATLLSNVHANLTNRLTTIAGPLTSSPSSSQGPNGSLKFDFASAPQKLTPVSTKLNGQAVANRTLTGLPMIGMGAHIYNRAGVISTYGGVIPSRYTINTTSP